MSGEGDDAGLQSRSATVRLMFGGKRRAFRLAIGELRELQEETKAGPRELLLRFNENRERVDDIVETLRIGLIGGGMAPDAAGELVARYGPEGRPYIESTPVAQAVLLAAIIGAPEEEVGKKKRMPGWRTKPNSQTGASASPTSTPPDTPSDTIPEPSTA